MYTYCAISSERAGRGARLLGLGRVRRVRRHGGGAGRARRASLPQVARAVELQAALLIRHASFIYTPTCSLFFRYV